MKKHSPDSSASVTWSQDPGGPCQGFCARDCLLRVHSRVYLVKRPNKLAVLSCSGTDGLILLGWTPLWVWEAAAPGHILEVLAQNLPLRVCEPTQAASPRAGGGVGFLAWVQGTRHLLPGRRGDRPVSQPRPWRERSGTSQEFGLHLARPASRLPCLVTLLSSCGHLAVLNNGLSIPGACLEPGFWGVGVVLQNKPCECPGPDGGSPSHGRPRSVGAARPCRTQQAGGAADAGRVYVPVWGCTDLYTHTSFLS